MEDLMMHTTSMVEFKTTALLSMTNADKHKNMDGRHTRKSCDRSYNPTQLPHSPPKHPILTLQPSLLSSAQAVAVSFL